MRLFWILLIFSWISTRRLKGDCCYGGFVGRGGFGVVVGCVAGLGGLVMGLRQCDSEHLWVLLPEKRQVTATNGRFSVQAYDAYCQRCLEWKTVPTRQDHIAYYAPRSK